MARRRGRPRPRVRRRVPRRGPRRRPLSLAVGPQRAAATASRRATTTSTSTQLEGAARRSYGPLVEVWFDGANGEGPNGKRQVYDWPRIHAAVRRLQPNAVMFSDSGPGRALDRQRGRRGRHDLLEHASIPNACRIPGSTRRGCSRALMQGDPDGTRLAPGRGGRLDPARLVLAPGSRTSGSAAPTTSCGLYFRSVGRNSKLLLNVPPTRDGLFHDRDVQALEAFDAKRRALFDRRRPRRRPRARQQRQHARRRPRCRPRQPLAGVRRHDVSLAGGGAARARGVRHAAAGGGHRARPAHRQPPRRRVARERWQTVAWGTTIGNARLHNCAPTTASRIRVVVEFAYDAPALRRIAAYQSPDAKCVDLETLRLEPTLAGASAPPCAPGSGVPAG